jgi:hypothetical protein
MKILMSYNQTRKICLTTSLSLSKLGTLAVTRPTARAVSSERGCRNTLSHSQLRMGHDLSKQAIPKSEFENRWPTCLRKRRGLNGTSDIYSNLGNADPATEWPSRLDDASLPENPCSEIPARDWQALEQPAQAIRPARRDKRNAGKEEGLKWVLHVPRKENMKSIVRYAIAVLLSLAFLSCGSGQPNLLPPDVPPAPTMLGVWQGIVYNSLGDVSCSNPGACYSATIIITEEGLANGTDTPFKGTYVTNEPVGLCASEGMQSGAVSGRRSSVPLDSFGNNIEAAFTPSYECGVQPIAGLGIIDPKLRWWTGKWDFWACWFVVPYEHWFTLEKIS